MSGPNETPNQLGFGFDEAEPTPVPTENTGTESAVGKERQEATLEATALQSTAGLETLLKHWQAEGWLRALDVQFARLLGELGATDTQPVTPLTLMLAALTSHQVGRGHVCMDLGQLLQDADATLALPPDDSQRQSLQQDVTLAMPSAILADHTLTDCLNDLRTSPVVGTPDAGPVTPLVLDGTRLYLRRFLDYEQRIAAGIQQRLNAASNDPLVQTGGPEAGTLARALSVLFAGESRPDPDDQKLASALAARNRFAIITGGPGTGKTTTVVRLLAALQAVAGETAGRKLRIRLAAPTGKASARLNESIGGAVHRLPLADLPGSVSTDDIPAEVTTLHRLLGSRPGSRQFRHHRDNPLRLDLLVIDEASMVDVDLMASVFDALPDTARLILLGDKDQLASVDAGAVLGELCERAVDGHYQPATRQWLETVTGETLPNDREEQDGRPLDQAVAMLRHSYRFTADSGIGRLARAVNAGALSPELHAACRNGELPDVVWVRNNTASAPADELISEHALTGSPEQFGGATADRAPVGYRHYLERMRESQLTSAAPRADWDDFARSILAAFSDFQVLCALRQGPWGVEGLNYRIADRLVRAGLIPRATGWYSGRPVLVTANDYNLGLMNGDIGITLEVPWGDRVNGEPQPVLRVAFPGETATAPIRWVSPSRLQHLETVFAMTVHKSQGSEFTHTCLVLPDRTSPVLTRELIYTGITRARHWFSLVTGHPQVLDQAVRTRVTRASGLRAKL